MFLLFDCITLNEASQLWCQQENVGHRPPRNESTWPRKCQLCKESHAADAFSLWWVYLVISSNTNTAV